jgi:hypothetical protein
LVYLFLSCFMHMDRQRKIFKYVLCRVANQSWRQKRLVPWNNLPWIINSHTIWHHLEWIRDGASKELKHSIAHIEHNFRAIKQLWTKRKDTLPSWFIIQDINRYSSIYATICSKKKVAEGETTWIEWIFPFSPRIPPLPPT